MRLVGSDLEDESSDFSLAPRPTVAVAPTMTTKRPRGRPAGSANKVTKPAQKTTGRRTSDRIAAAVAAELNPGETNGVLSEKSANQQNIAAPKKGAKGTVSKIVEKPKPTRGRPRTVKKPAETPTEVDQAEGESMAVDTELPAPTPVPKGRRGRKPVSSKTEIPETQPPPEQMDIDEGEDDELGELPQHPSIEPEAPAALPAVPSSVRSQRVVDLDSNDPSIRRKLGDLSKRYDILESKYRHLQEVGTREAERNFDRLKKQAEERAQSKY